MHMYPMQEILWYIYIIILIHELFMVIMNIVFHVCPVYHTW